MFMLINGTRNLPIFAFAQYFQDFAAQIVITTRFKIQADGDQCVQIALKHLWVQLIVINQSGRLDKIPNFFHDIYIWYRHLDIALLITVRKP